LPFPIEKVDDKTIKINGHTIKIYSEKDPALIKWGDVGAEYICESTGAFLT